jgi:2-oxoglutarate ferredoxin oxidoreductase subunit beta
MSHPEFPEPMGVFRDIQRPSYAEIVHAQIAQAIEKNGPGDLQTLVNGEDTWTVD